MSSGLEKGVSNVFGGIIVLSIVTSMVEAIGHALNITFFSALTVCASATGIVVFWKSKWMQERKPCSHGVWRGLRGNCSACRRKEVEKQEEKKRLKEQWDAKQQERDRQELLRTKAERLRQKEIERLSKAWLGSAEAYFGMDPRKFENAIAELFRALGYQVRVTPYSNDGGKDAILRKNDQKFLVECKRYAATRSVGRRDMQIFASAMRDESADSGFSITTGTFTRTATDYARKNRIETYDRSRLPELVNLAYPSSPSSGDMSQGRFMCLKCGDILCMPIGETAISGKCVAGHSVTSNITQSDFRTVISKERPYCECGAPMRIVKWDNRRFWGCTRYPRCKQTKPLELRTRNVADRVKCRVVC